MQSGDPYTLTNNFVKVFEGWALWIAVAAGGVIGLHRAYKKLKEYFLQDNFITIHSEIHEILTELRVVCNAARTQVHQFHNGGYFIDGISMRKFSLTHESVEKAVESDANKIQNQLCSIYLPLVQLVVEDDPKLRYTADMKDSFVKQYFESRNVEAFCVLPIKLQNNITGFTLLQWCSSKIVDTVDPDLCSREMRRSNNAITVQLAQQKR
jgi:transcriptional regulator with GAF, ATPase, and Fis domain